MNTLGKVGLAAALTMSYVSAHAAFVAPTSTTPGDVFLFAEVLNSSGTLVGSYAGDTQTAVSNGITTMSISASSDANLQTLLNLLSTSGNTLEWAVQGGGGTNNGAVYGNPGTSAFVTTITTPLAFTPTGGNLDQWSALGNTSGTTINTINSKLANPGDKSIFATSSANGGQWDTTILTTNVHNWFSNGGNTEQKGYSNATLYYVTGNGETSPALITSMGTATMSSTGFTFTAGTAPVPLPAAVWLLGSGLLGLAGVGRRKAKSA